MVLDVDRLKADKYIINLWVLQVFQAGSLLLLEVSSGFSRRDWGQRSVSKMAAPRDGVLHMVTGVIETEEDRGETGETTKHKTPISQIQERGVSEGIEGNIWQSQGPLTKTQAVQFTQFGPTKHKSKSSQKHKPEPQSPAKPEILFTQL